MRWIDMHCDTLWQLMDLKEQGDLMENQCSVSIPSMKKGGTLAQLFACFTYLEDYGAKGAYDKGYVHILDMICFFDQQIQTYSKEIAHAYSRRDWGAERFFRRH